jgi:glucose-fructose oxidoreductase
MIPRIDCQIGLTIDGETQEQTFEPHSQLAAEFTYFSNCTLQGEDLEPSGVEGLNDIRTIQALHQSIQQNKPAALDQMDHPRHPSPELITVQPPNPETPKPVHAASPGDSETARAGLISLLFTQQAYASLQF